MSWIRKNFVELVEDSTEVQRERYARWSRGITYRASRYMASIRQMIGNGELACDPEYMSWFRIHGKPYLCGEEARRRYPHTNRPRQGSLNPRGGEAGPSSVPTQESASAMIPKPPPSICWTVGHPSLMWYMPGPSHFPITLIPMMTYRPSMYEVSMGGPLIIPSVYGTQHSYAHSSLVTQTPRGSCSIKVGHLPNHLFIDQGMHDGNQECKDRNRPKVKKRSNRDHNPAQKLIQEGIQSVTVNHPDAAQISIGICID
ncbi:hypothetical protein Gotri_002765 [Gossypium trilobum]|uniref:Uncharacterized protein n=1 Tax=Gossypium trilobum TaxID=34281 RepID=A0A7J9FAA0_9ROSI|nr:hypothetical protein [Gossypium trilobum]